MLAGQPATHCDYRQCGGPLRSRMTSLVILRLDRWLALEFRSEENLNRDNHRIPASFSLHPGRPGD